jgi:hypothetical protein
MSFLDQLRQTTNTAATENDAVTNQSTLDPVLDFFSRAGAMRGRIDEATVLFNRAYAQDSVMALRALFYLRDVRGGQGERDMFRACLKLVPKEVLQKNLACIPEYGRYDDLFTLDATLVIPFIKEQLQKDTESMKKGDSVSLLAKWMPSENTSSEKTQKLARVYAKALGLKPIQYRKTIVALRKHITLLEQKMSQNKWKDVEYDKIPSQAFRKHTKAFRRHDEERYGAFLEAVQSGEKKIKTSTLYTYEVFDTIQKDEQAANAMWVSLPDYTNGQNALVMADVSGSMDGRPMSISVSLALYFAERNKGPLGGFFMTFSNTPQMVQVLGDTLSEKLQNIENAQWDQSTNLEAAFMAILQAAKSTGAKGDDMPKVLYVISDMEFNQCVHNGGLSNFENAKALFAEAGFTLPHVVFWNVDSRNDQSPALKNEKNVSLISGSSQSAFKLAVEGKTPLETMNDVLKSERYSQVTV